MELGRRLAADSCCGPHHFGRRQHSPGPLTVDRSAPGIDELYFKLETGNPTNSYKDRFAAVAISDAVAQGKRKIIATSSGNTGAALAAYAAAAGLQCDITLVEHAPADKLRQMLAYGANLYRVRSLACERKSIARCSARWRNSAAAGRLDVVH